jgi:hypothetical protein
MSPEAFKAALLVAAQSDDAALAADAKEALRRLKKRGSK